MHVYRRERSILDHQRSFKFIVECVQRTECIDNRHTFIYTSAVKKVFDWNNAKNKKLIKERHISFEAVVSLIESGNIIALVTGKGKYAHQKQFIVELNRYIYVIP